MDVAAYVSTPNGSAVVVLGFAMVTALVMEAINFALMKAVEKRPWWPHTAALQKQLMLNFGVKEENCTPEALLDSYVFVLCICGHHFVTGGMTLPVIIYGWSGAGATGQLLFLMAVLADVGFDVYDWIKKFFLTFFHSVFKFLGPPYPLSGFIVMCCLHHPLAMTLVIPMNLKYSSLPDYHKIACSLLLAAGVCFLAGQYKFTLNMKDRFEFIQIKTITLVQCITIWYTRGFVWFTSFYSAMSHFRAEGDTTFCIGGCIAGTLMSLFNLVLLSDVTMTTVKTLPKPLPATEEQREELQSDLVRQHSSMMLPGQIGFGARKMRSAVKAAVAAQKFKAALHKDQ